MMMVESVTHVRFYNRLFHQVVVWKFGNTIEVCYEEGDIAIPLEAHTLEEPNLDGASRWANSFFDMLDADLQTQEG